MDGLPLLNFASGEPALLETHVGPKGLAATYLQQDPATGRWLPVAAYSRELVPPELQKSVALLEITAIQEALKKVPYVALYADALEVRVSPEVAQVFKSKLHLGPELTWRVCDISAYGL